MISVSTKIHEGRNLSRIRQILGIKQITIAVQLDLSQQTISQCEQRETINPVLLESIAKVLAIDPYVIRNFNEERAIQIITSSLNKNITEEPDEESLGFGQFANTVSRYHGHHTQFSPYEKLIELYEKLLNEKDEKIKNLIRIAEPENIQ